MREIAQVRRRFGYRRIHVMLRREGWAVNHKRVYRLYRLEGLSVRTKKRKKRASHLRVVPAAPAQANEWCWRGRRAVVSGAPRMSGTALQRYPSAPAAKASAAESASFTMVSMRMRARGSRRRISGPQPSRRCRRRALRRA